MSPAPFKNFNHTLNSIKEEVGTIIHTLLKSSEVPYSKNHLIRNHVQTLFSMGYFKLYSMGEIL